MTTKYNPGEYVLLMARVDEIAIGMTCPGASGGSHVPFTTIRYHLDIDAGDKAGYMLWMDEGKIVGTV